MSILLLTGGYYNSGISGIVIAVFLLLIVICTQHQGIKNKIRKQQLSIMEIARMILHVNISFSFPQMA